jgi:hypothetical protein
VLSDRRFACGRVLAVGSGTTYGSRSRFLAGLLDWVGAEPPSVESIAGALLLEAGYAHIATIAYDGGAVLGERSLESDGLALRPMYERTGAVRLSGPTGASSPVTRLGAGSGVA